MIEAVTAVSILIKKQYNWDAVYPTKLISGVSPWENKNTTVCSTCRNKPKAKGEYCLECDTCCDMQITVETEFRMNYFFAKPCKLSFNVHRSLSPLYYEDI